MYLSENDLHLVLTALCAREARVYGFHESADTDVWALEAGRIRQLRHRLRGTMPGPEKTGPLDSVQRFNDGLVKLPRALRHRFKMAPYLSGFQLYDRGEKVAWGSAPAVLARALAMAETD